MKEICPICQYPYTSRSRFKCDLECQHRLCFCCAKTWLYKNYIFTCPFCRQLSHFFEKNVRSNQFARSLLSDFSNKIQPILHFSSQIQPSIYYIHVSHLLQIYFIQHVSYWYKPCLRKSLLHIYKVIQSIFIHLHHPLLQMDPKEKKNVFDILFRVSDILHHQMNFNIYE